MRVRRLIISDLHFGSGDDLLGSPAALERLEPELAWADELVINGDLLELVFASLQEAVDAARPFLRLVNRHVGRVHYVVGNHDHHLVSLAGDERRFAEVLGLPAARMFGVAPADRLLHALCPDVDVVSVYPQCRLDGMCIMHGHYIAPHVGSSDWRLADRLAWYLGGFAVRPDRLTVSDYEGLIAPLYELMYEIANLPSGPCAQQRLQRWLGGAAAIARAPKRTSRRLATLAHVLSHHGDARLLLGSAPPTTKVLEAMQAVCGNLEVQAATVVFGHTHVALDGVMTPNGRYRLFNSGAWVWDRRLRGGAGHREHGWPGTVLRATDGELELRALLADCDDGDLARMIGKAPRHRRRGKPRQPVPAPTY